MAMKYKHLESNKRRLLSLEQRNNDRLNSTLIVQNALRLQDGNNTDKNQRTHIKFDDSDGENETSSKESQANNHDELLGLDNDDVNELVLNTQFEGQSGQELMEIQSRIGGDSRFKIDERFAEDSSSNEQDTACVELSEVQSNLKVMNMVLAESNVKSMKRKTHQFIDPSKRRYDPSKQEDVKVLERNDTNISKKKRKKEKVPITPAPEVNKERFYNANINVLKQAFVKGQASSKDDNENVGVKFSLLSMFGGEDEKDKCEDVKEERGIEQHDQPKPLKATPASLHTKPFYHDDSNSEDDMDFQDNVHNDHDSGCDKKMEEERDCQETLNGQSIIGAPQVSTFFLTGPDDPRLIEGINNFYTNKTASQIRDEWLEVKDMLRADYKKKHRDAVRLLKRAARNHTDEERKIWNSLSEFT